MLSHIFGSIVAAFVALGSLFSHATSTPVVVPADPGVSSAVHRDAASDSTAAAPAKSAPGAAAPLAKTQRVLSQADLLAMAGNKYIDGRLPLGDGKYVTSGPKKGYIYLCHAQADMSQGARGSTPWVSGSVWDPAAKPSVTGSVSWPNAAFSDVVNAGMRLLSGNDLPLSHTTGIFPIGSNDPASVYDRNPNSIIPQKLSVSVPANPQYSDAPYCMGGEVGVMLSGVALFNGFDAELRDAAAHEIQDSCDGHPQEAGEYHYHSLSSCFQDTSVETVLGFAYDGFPITGSVVARGKYLTTDDLDECHGITSEIMLDGKKTVTYHYVMTKDFPYSASCFRGKPVTTRPTAAPNAASGGQSQTGRTIYEQANQIPGQPPQAAIDACAAKASGQQCTISTPQNGLLSGTCRVPPNASSLACIPN